MPPQHPYARWMALGRIKGMGRVSFKKLATHFSDPTMVFSASAAELACVEGLDQAVIDGVRGFSAWEEVHGEIRKAEKAGVSIVPFNGSAYPPRLRTIPDPPPCLFVKGDWRVEDDKAVAVVGSRSASEYGCRVARDLCRGLVRLGFTVVSGMARGIDGMAHVSALEAGGRTIAVLGSGVDRPYPPEHVPLYRRIIQSGAVISEFPLGTRPLAFNFPARNRLISGLSLGVVVVEATEKSGSLITAALALEQGREIFAVPGEVGASRSRGAHRLIRQGAKLVEGVEDIIEEIAPQLLAHGHSGLAMARKELPAEAGDDGRKIWQELRDRPLQIDEIIERSGLTPSRVAEILLELELQGFVLQLPGKRYLAEQ